MRFASLPPAALVVLGAVACDTSGLPHPSSDDYRDAVSAFYRGVAAAQVGEGGLAEAAFARVTELAPGEPAGWANLGVTALQRRELDQAVLQINRAVSRMPGSGDLEYVAAVAQRESGRTDSAIAHLRRAVDLHPDAARPRFFLAQLLGETDAPQALAEALQELETLLVEAPGNLVILLERTRLAARLRDSTTVSESVDDIVDRLDALGIPAPPELTAVRNAIELERFDQAATETVFLQTALQPLPPFQNDRDAVVTASNLSGIVLTRFLRLPTPSSEPSPPDLDLGFTLDNLTVGAGSASWVRAFWMSEEAPLTLIAADRDSVWISPAPEVFEAHRFPGQREGGSPAPSGVTSLDYDYDFRQDVALAGSDGLRLLRQEADGSYADVTVEAIPPSAADQPSLGVWSADLDMEGDLDLVVATASGPPLTLRNLGDGTFEPDSSFPGARDVRDFAWADLDGDGDPDATLLEHSGRLSVFLNDRSASPPFRSVSVPDTTPAILAVETADWNRDGTIDLLVLDGDGALSRWSYATSGWATERITDWPGMPDAPVSVTVLLTADLDNNGDVDLLASTPEAATAWLRTADAVHPVPLPSGGITDIVDINADGRLDLIGISPDGATQMFSNEGTLDYYSTNLRPRAAETTGDRRINPFGVGGEVEIRAGLLYQKKVIRGPTVHVGLGDRPMVDVARIIWPNGSAQAEFNLGATNATILTRQRLKGSCPWVFTFDGQGMQFVTDFIWRSALGLRINAQGEAAVMHGEDWIRIRGDQLVPRDGYYDVRITAELWETHFFDHVALLVVDHPAATDVFVDERFTLPAPEPTVRPMEPLRPVTEALDDLGNDVTDLVRDLDERFVDSFALGPYQGVARDHFVEIAVADEAETDAPLWLVASGWVYPTDASINVAISQGGHEPPRGVRLDVADGSGGWVTIDEDLGFPAGKTKTILLDLAGAFRPGAPRRLRLVTNMEIYWDRIGWTIERPGTEMITQRLLPTTADLRYRGFSEVRQASRTAPELPMYDRVATTVPMWRDLVGFHTRFGDVRELNAAVDDRYTIMNAGDELQLRFAAPPPPPEGWTRDFVLIGDGWVKDGDYNTGYSTTVLPLPYHGMNDYGRAPDQLVNDPAYRRHADDWRRYHTRFVTPRDFSRALSPDPTR